MTNINKACTPTLIQHGELDKRVPIPNAYELYRGLQDRNIPSKLIVYKGFGHGIKNPKKGWQLFGITGNGLISMFLERRWKQCRLIKIPG